MINDFGYGKKFEISAGDPMNFPYMWVESTDSTFVMSPNSGVGYRELIYGFNVYIMDKNNKGYENQQDTISDTHYILTTVLTEIAQHKYYVDMNISLYGDIDIQPLVEDTQDDSNGWVANIRLKVPMRLTPCVDPIQPITGYTVSLGSNITEYRLIGSQGPTGPQGFQGATGPQGSVGSQGFQGATGPQGSVGSQGSQGATGPQGFQGTQGFQGNQGFQGTTGSQGFQGPTGPTTTSVLISNLLAATGINTINNANFKQEWQWNTLTGNDALKLSSTSTGASSSTQTILNISLSGANATHSQTTYGSKISNTHTGATSTNVALSVSSSGGTNNYALIAPSGSVGIGTSNPTSSSLSIKGTGITTATSPIFIENSGGTQLFKMLNDGSLALGSNATLNADNTIIAIGTNANPTRGGDINIGNKSNSTGSGTRRIAIGDTATCSSSGTGGISIGYLTTNTGTSGIVLGTLCSIDGTRNMAIGYSTTTLGRSDDIAIGINASLTGVSGSGKRLLLGQYITSGAVGNGGTMVFGSGIDASNLLSNSIAESAIWGFNSTSPSLFLNKNSNLLLISGTAISSGTHFNTTATNTLTLYSGTETSGSLVDAIQIYSKDRTTGKAGLNIWTEDGTKHIFSDLSGIGTQAPVSTLEVAGSFGPSISLKTANYTLTSSDYTVIFDGTTLTATLPAASTCTRRIYVIVNRNATALTTSIAYQTLTTGVTSTTVTAATSVWIQSDGTNYYQIK